MVTLCKEKKKKKKGMASYKRRCQFILASATLSMLCFSCFMNQSQAEKGIGKMSGSSLVGVGANFSSEDEDDSAPVVLSLYYESLCPFCANFIVNELVKVFETDLISAVKLRLVPWGNTIVTPNNSWICQHGPDECMLNMVEACAIYSWPDPRVHYKFIYCIEKLRLNNNHSQWQSCFATLQLSSMPVRNCFSSGLAVKLEQGYGDETAHLNPQHRFVPWVVVNNLPLQQDYQNFVGYICKAYKGAVTPQACKSRPIYEMESFTTANIDDASQVCFKTKN